MDDKLMIVVLAGVIGAIIGSFLNVCILRLPKEESVVHPPSHCPRCGAGVRFYDNVPIVSWLVLRGKCRSCSNPISWQYPVIELATAILWAWMAWRFSAPLEILNAALFLTLLLGIAMTDAREYIIPDEFSLGGLAIGLALSLRLGLPGLVNAAIGAAVGFGVLWAVAALGRRMFGKEAMGGGDIKMMAMIGAFLGWQGVFLTIFLGSVLGTLIFGPMALSGRKKEVPFGIFLALGAAVMFLWGSPLIDWYRGFVGIA